MAAFLDVVRFNPTVGGTSDWTVSSAVPGYMSPAAAGAVNGTKYKYRAESADLSQWEIGEGAYNATTGVLARTTVLFNSAGTTAVINFSTAPQVAIVALAEDLPNLTTPNRFTDATEATGAGTTAAVIISGGLEILKKLFVTGVATFRAAISVSDTTSATNATTGSIHTAGGMSASGAIWAGGKVNTDSGFSSTAGPSLNAVYNGVQFNGCDLASTSSSDSAWGVMRNPTGICGTIRTIGASTVYNTSSDRRLKESLEPLSDSGTLIDALNVYRFTWKADGAQGAGVIAQEAFEVYPLAISKGDDAEEVDTQDVKSVWGADYSKFVPLLLAEVKALRTRVAALEAKAS
jgi:endosialidase-like protein